MRHIGLLAVLALACSSGRALAAPATPRITVIDAPPQEADESTPITAPGPDASRVAEARRLGSRGLAAYDAHEYSAAIEHLTSAIALHDAPSLRLYRARSYAQLARWEAACEDYGVIRRGAAIEGETPIAAQARTAAVPEGKDACDRVAAPSAESLPRDAVPASPVEASPSLGTAIEREPRAESALHLDVSLFGSINNRVEFSEGFFDSYGPDSSSLAGRMSLTWYGLPKHAAWLGFGASWVQDYGMGRFNYTEALGAVTSRYLVGRWHFGAQLGVGYLSSGTEVLSQRYALIKPSAEAGVRLGALSARAIAAFIIPVEEVGNSLYTRSSGYGGEGALVLDYRLWRWLGTQVTGSLSRLALDLEDPADGLIDREQPPPSVSVLDQYTSLFVSLSASL